MDTHKHILLALLTSSLVNCGPMYALRSSNNVMGKNSPQGATSQVAPSPVQMKSMRRLYSKSGLQTFQVPAGVKELKVTAVGAGGGAGSPGAHSTDAGNAIYSWGSGAGGGGSGGVCRGTLQVQPGQSLELTIGAGGLGGHGIPSTFITYNDNGHDGFPTMVAGMLAGSGFAGHGGSGSYRYPPHYGPGIGGEGGARGECIDAGNLSSDVGQAGLKGQDYSQVAGQQAFIHADGGVGGAGLIIDGVECGAGADAFLKNQNGSDSPSGADGCILIEWMEAG